MNGNLYSQSSKREKCDKQSEAKVQPLGVSTLSSVLSGQNSVFSGIGLSIEDGVLKLPFGVEVNFNNMDPSTTNFRTTSIEGWLFFEAYFLYFCAVFFYSMFLILKKYSNGRPDRPY